MANEKKRWNRQFRQPKGKSTTLLLYDAGRFNRLRSSTIREAMRAKPKLGQHFLNDSQAIQRIASSIGDLARRTVVEIGPGRGAITGALADRAAHVLAIELDAQLAARLRAEFPPERVTVLEQDVLSFNFDEARAKFAETDEPLLVVGNLPYSITSPILLKLAANYQALDRAVLMVQREVADRVVAPPGSRDYGLLSVTVQMYGPAERLFTLPPAAFAPPPDVHSTVFRWRFAPRFKELGIEEGGFLRFVRQCFAQKRKTLANNLRAAGIPPETVAVALNQTAVAPQARAEALSAEKFATLWRSLETQGATSHDEAAPDSGSV
ncbi:MAG: 16S rRNA (adenine(1518)-N(6)/adenine(1519)-N(6))-dimethyltransferase RsmA [Terracidiphilus sp.]|jgi:16S rRNA (adenine1518-N6/adenine1519-N6)-dimethyltransferase